MVTLEILAWLGVIVEIQVGLLLVVLALMFWTFCTGGGFAHVRVAGIVLTAYKGGGEWVKKTWVGGSTRGPVLVASY